MYTDYSLKHLTPSPCITCRNIAHCNWECYKFYKWAYEHQKEIDTLFTQNNKKSEVSENSF